MEFFPKIVKVLFVIFQIILIVLLIVLAVVFVIVMLADCPKWIFSYLGIAQNGEPKYEALKFLGIGMGGVLVALQALMSYRRAKAMEETANAQADAANAQAKATEEQAKANRHTEQGQRQERLKNAIEHLGHEKDSVRLGGAYELFHLAKDTLEDTEKLSQTVLDILCAHIRRTTGESEYREAHKSKPSEEIQSLLRLLFVQKHKVFKDCHINLQGSWLNGADLKKARLAKVVLTQAHLRKAELVRAQLQGANLHEAKLQGAFLAWAKMQGAFLNSAQLQGAALDVAEMQGAKLDEAQLQEARFSITQLQGATLSGAQLQGAQLIQTQLQGAALFGAQLQGANLAGAQLHGANSEESFSSVVFEGRIRSRINKESNLSEVIFAGGLSREDVDSLVGDLGPNYPYSGGISGLLRLLRRFLNRDRGKPEILRQTLKDLSAEKANELREKLTPHIGQPASNQLPKNSGAITRSYTEEEAEQWIAEYEQAVSGVPRDDS